MNRKLKQNKKGIIITGISIVVFISVFLSVYLFKMKNTKAAQVATTLEQTENLPKYKESDLSIYNGDDLSKPIYIGLNGYVYDVSSGRKYYEKGGTYHYLAGKDSSKELNLIGGDIIKNKYPVVGILAD